VAISTVTCVGVRHPAEKATPAPAMKSLHHAIDLGSIVGSEMQRRAHDATHRATFSNFIADGQRCSGLLEGAGVGTIGLSGPVGFAGRTWTFRGPMGTDEGTEPASASAARPASAAADTTSAGEPASTATTRAGSAIADG